MLVQSTYLVAPPSFQKTPPAFVEVRDRERLTITCSAIGNPQPVISWKRDNQTIEDGVKIQVNCGAGGGGEWKMPVCLRVGPGVRGLGVCPKMIACPIFALQGVSSGHCPPVLSRFSLPRRDVWKSECLPQQHGGAQAERKRC